MSDVEDAVPDNLLLLPIPHSHVRPVEKKGRVRDVEAARLKALGWSLLDIAKRLGLGDETDPDRAEARVAAAIKRAMADAVRFARDEARQLELLALDELELRLWRLLDEHPALVQHGKIVLNPETQEPMEDLRFILEVVDRIKSIRDQRAKVTGVYAPIRTEAIEISFIDAEIARLEKQLGQTPGAA